MFAVVKAVLLKPLAFREPDKLVSVHGFAENIGEFWGFSNPDLADVRSASRLLAVAAWTFRRRHY
jgi:hypothetical protein